MVKEEIKSISLVKLVSISSTEDSKEDSFKIILRCKSKEKDFVLVRKYPKEIRIPFFYNKIFTKFYFPDFKVIGAGPKKFACLKFYSKEKYYSFLEKIKGKLKIYFSEEKLEDQFLIKEKLSSNLNLEYISEREVKITPSTKKIEVNLKKLFFDIEVDLDTEEIVLICSNLVEKNQPTEERSFSGSEKKILIRFRQYLIKVKPDLICGFNILNYDLIKIEEKAKEHNLESPFNFIKNKKNWIKHTFFFDLYVKLEKAPYLRKNLNYLAKKILKIEKEKVELVRLKYRMLSKKEREKIISYCKKDVLLTERIYEKLKIDKCINSISNVLDLPCEKSKNKEEELIEILIKQEKQKKGIVSEENTSLWDKKILRKKEQKNFKQGYLENVLVLDYSDLIFEILEKKRKEEYKNDIFKKVVSDFVLKLKSRIKGNPSEENFFLNDLKKKAIEKYKFSFFENFIKKEACLNEIQLSLKKNLKGNLVIFEYDTNIFIELKKKDLKENLLEAQKIEKELKNCKINYFFNKLMLKKKKKTIIGKSVWPIEKIFLENFNYYKSTSFEYQEELLDWLIKGIYQNKPKKELKIGLSKRKKLLKEEKIDPELLKINYLYIPSKIPTHLKREVEKLKKIKNISAGETLKYFIINSNPIESLLEEDMFLKNSNIDWGYYINRVLSTLENNIQLDEE